MPWFRPGEQTGAQVEIKSGGSPVTEADYAVDRFLHRVLRKAVPDAAWLSEETADAPSRLQAETVIIVDPIDGTKAFMAGDDRWCISIALVENGRPSLGVLFAPARNELCIAIRDGGAQHNGKVLKTEAHKKADWSHAGPQQMMRNLPALRNRELNIVPRVPSLAYRLLMVAKGDVASAAASPDSHDWDIAAADLILSEAGCRLMTAAGVKPKYNRPVPRHPALLAAHRSLF